MARSSCVKCDHNIFEITEFTPSGADYKINFVQCSKCGGVVGVLDFYNIGQLILNLANRLNVSLSE